MAVTYTESEVFEQSIARQVASYTDLDLTSKTGEYYMEFNQANHGETGYVRPAGSLSLTIDNWLVEVLNDMFGKVKMIGGESLPHFTSTESLGHTVLSGGYELSALDTGDQGIDILGVQVVKSGKEYKAYPGDVYQLHNYSDPNSMYKALSSSPVYLVNQGKLYVFPIDANLVYNVEYLSAPNIGVFISSPDNENKPVDTLGDYGITSSERHIKPRPSAICHLFASSFKDDNELAEGRQYMPDTYLSGLVYGVSSRLLAKRMLDMQKQIPSLDDYSTLTGDAQFTESETSDGWQKVRYYIESEEDAELAGLKMSELNGQQQAWVLKYQWYGQQKQLVDSQYISIFNAQQREN